MSKERRSGSLHEEVDALGAWAIELSLSLHADPELALREVRSAQLLRGWLEDEGFDVTAPVAGLDTAFLARFGHGRPCVAYLLEYDALPGIGHGCGHNLIATGGLVAATALRRHRGRDDTGSIAVIGTPGEEGAGGKAIELAAGVFDDVDAAIMFHPADRTIVSRRMLACLHLTVRFFGVAAHAAKNPEAGRNALAAMIQFFVGVDGLRQHVEADARVHGIITNGGAAANVVPDLTEADFYVRHRTLEAARALAERVTRCAEGAALATGTRAEVTASAPPYAHLHTNHVMAERIEAHLRGLGVDVEAPSADDATGSTDAGNVSLALPTVHPFLQIADTGVPSHSLAFRDAAATPRAHAAMLTMAKAMADLGADLLSGSDLLERARFEHAERLGRRVPSDLGRIGAEGESRPAS